GGSGLGLAGSASPLVAAVCSPRPSPTKQPGANLLPVTRRLTRDIGDNRKAPSTRILHRLPYRQHPPEHIRKIIKPQHIRPIARGIVRVGMNLKKQAIDTDGRRGPGTTLHPLAVATRCRSPHAQLSTAYLL